MSQIVVVTGAFGNLGAAVARAFAAAGAQVALVDFAPAPSGNLQSEFGKDHLLLGGVDFTSMDSAKGAIDKVVARFGGVDALINIAGGFRWETLADGDLATWDKMFSMNIKTAATAAKAALPHLKARGKGRIINIGAGAAAKPAAAGMGAYTASKAGVAKLTEALSEEVKDQGITVNAILPGTIDTPQNRADMPTADFSRWVAPAAIAGVIVFLASDAGAPITGAQIPVYGRG